MREKYEQLRSEALAKDIEVTKLKIDVAQAGRLASGLKGKNDLLNIQVNDMNRQMVILKDQLTITKQEARQVGMKSSIPDPEDALKLEQALVRTIKRQRVSNNQEDREVSIDEKRVVGRQNIMSFVKELKFFLTPWAKILEALIVGKRPTKFEHLAYL